MTKVNLGRVVGRDAGFGNFEATYTDDGGDPSVSVNATGDDSAKDISFDFKNIAPSPLTSNEIDQASNDVVLTSKRYLDGPGVSTLWARIKAKFASKSHTHDASDITAGQLAAALIANGTITADMLAASAVTTAKIQDGAVTDAKLSQSVRDSLSRTPKAVKESTGAYYAWIDIPLDDLTLRIGFHGTRGLLVLTRSGSDPWHQEYPAS